MAYPKIFCPRLRHSHHIFQRFILNFPFIHKDLLFETYTGHVQNDYSSYEYINILIFECLIGQGKMQIRVREF